MRTSEAAAVKKSMPQSLLYLYSISIIMIEILRTKVLDNFSINLPDSFSSLLFFLIFFKRKLAISTKYCCLKKRVKTWQKCSYAKENIYLWVCLYWTLGQHPINLQKLSIPGFLSLSNTFLTKKQHNTLVNFRAAFLPLGLPEYLTQNNISFLYFYVAVL